MPPTPEVTVLMPVHNGERYVGAAIDSVLAQSMRAFELLIVDDGSTDATADIVAAYRDGRIRVERFDRNRGLSAALNHGLACAAAPLVARQDADDLSAPTRLERQIAAMRSDADLALLGTQAEAIDEAGNPLKPVDRPLDRVSIEWYGMFDNPFAHTSVMFRRDVIQQLGGFDATCDPYSQDYALWWRVMRRHRVGNLRDRLVTYRVRRGSIISRLDEANDEDYRRRFDGIVRRLIPAHILEVFDAVVSPQDAALMSAFVLGIPRRDLDRFLDVFCRLLRAYLDRQQAAAESPEFRRTLSRQFDAIAYRIEAGTRLDVARVFASALREGAVGVRDLSWTRGLALLLFGRSGRDAIGRWRVRIAHHG